MENAKILYGVNCIDPRAENPDIGFSGPQRGGLLRATARDPTGKFIEPYTAPSAWYGKTSIAVGGYLCDLDPPVDPAYLSCTRNGDFRSEWSLNRERTPDDTYRHYLKIVLHLPKTSVKPGLVGLGLYSEQGVAAETRILEYTGNRFGGQYFDHLNAVFKSHVVGLDPQ